MAFKFVYKPKFALNTWYTFVNDHSYTWPVTVLHIAYIHSVLTAFECSCVNRTMNAPIKLLKMLRSVRCVCCGKLSLSEQQQNIIKIIAMRDEWIREATKKIIMNTKWRFDGNALNQQKHKCITEHAFGTSTKLTVHRLVFHFDFVKNKMICNYLLLLRNEKIVL